MKAYRCKCEECGAELVRANDRTIHFCNRDTCKANWQRRAKPVSKEWLIRKYLTEELNCTQIAEIVKRDPKSVWNWLKDLGIPTRKRGTDENQHFPKGHKLGVGRKLSVAHKQALRDARKKDGRIPAYVNGVHWMKAYGRKPGSWKGGITPDRQAFYASAEWVEVVPSVWKKADAKCERCGLDHRTIDRSKVRFHIHHVDSFMVRERRASVDNLKLLCDKCHRWVHGSQNKNGDFLGIGHSRRT